MSSALQSECEALSHLDDQAAPCPEVDGEIVGLSEDEVAALDPAGVGQAVAGQTVVFPVGPADVESTVAEGVGQTVRIHELQPLLVQPVWQYLPGLPSTSAP